MDGIVNIHDAKTQLSRLLARVAAGETITIAKAGHPVADLVPHRVDIAFGSLRGQLEYRDDDLGRVDPDISDMFYEADAHRAQPRGSGSIVAHSGEVGA